MYECVYTFIGKEVNDGKESDNMEKNWKPK